MKVKVVHSMWGKARGLMFSKRKNLMFVFDKEQIVPLHNWFVFFPIDVLFLDKNKMVVEIKKGFKPFSYYKPKKKAMYVVELVEKNDYKVGDKF